MSKSQTPHSMSIAKKLGLLTFSAILGIVVLTALFLLSERKLILEERQHNVRQVVESTYGVLTYYHDLETKGTLTAAQAQQHAIQAIRGLRYSGTEYFWVNDMQARIISCVGFTSQVAVHCLEAHATFC